MFVAYLVGLVYTAVRRLFFNHVIIDGFEFTFEIDEINEGDLLLTVSRGNVYTECVINIFVEDDDLHVYGNI